jgi:hypothetical protein
MTREKNPEEVAAGIEVDVEEVAKMLGIAIPLVLRRMNDGRLLSGRKVLDASPDAKTWGSSKPTSSVRTGCFAQLPKPTRSISSPSRSCEHAAGRGVEMGRTDMSVTYYVALPFVRSDDSIAAGEAVECFRLRAERGSIAAA